MGNERRKLEMENMGKRMETAMENWRVQKEWRRMGVGKYK